jgi:thiol-disulfide isomerase/thioredoxin
MFAMNLTVDPAFSQTNNITVTSIGNSALGKLISVNKGKVIILDLWSPRCPPCRDEIPGFINLYNKYKNKGLIIIGVSTDGTISSVQKFTNLNKINYQIFLDDKTVARNYQVQFIPTTIIFNKNGKIVNKHVGFVSESDFEKEILPLLK